MKSSRKTHPTIFLRIFLSHLFLLLAACFAAFIAYRYMFAPGAHLFVIHRPILIVPIILALMGIAGLLSIWTAGAIGIPLDNLTTRLQSDDPMTGLYAFRERINVQEFDELLLSLKQLCNSVPSSDAMRLGLLKEEHSTDALIVTVDERLMILHANRLARQHAPVTDEISGRYFTDVFAAASSTEAFATALRSMIADRKPLVDFSIDLLSAAGAPAPMRWNSLAVHDAGGKAVSWKMFGVME